MTRNSQPHIAYNHGGGGVYKFCYFLINTKNTIAEHCSKVQQINAYFDCSLRIATHRVVQFLPWSQDDRLSHLKYF